MKNKSDEKVPAREPLYGPARAESATPAAITWYPALSGNSGSCIIVCPGGGYRELMTGYEGDEICRWLAELGITAVLLEYRMSGNGFRHPAPLEDVQRAIRTARFRADRFGINPDRVGVMGFSAGGHLASSAATHFDFGIPDSGDAVDRMSCRPDFAVLCYPVIMLGSEYTNQGSQENLLGKDAPETQVDFMSSEKQVTPETPPCFFFHTDEDTCVFPENSVFMYLALKRNKIPAELHIFKSGPHGLGLAKGKTGAGNWPGLLVDWFKNLGVVG